jgi:hypothetical protein
MKSYAKILLALMPILTSLSAYAGGNNGHYYGGGDNHTSVGLRMGWIGAPNGVTVRRTFGNAAAFEFVAGYNGKYARRTELPALRKGNSFIGASFAPYFLMCEGNIGVALTADMGARLNYHHYRLAGISGAPKITPEVTLGAGMQVEFSERVELFADAHLKYFNEPHGYYVLGIESGAGLRIRLN